MSRIRADRVTNKEGTGAPLFPNGIRVVGLTSLSNVVAGVTTFTSDVSIGGTLTYEDVTNIDSVGLITARTGIKVLAGGINVVGVITATSYDGIDATSLKDSSGNIKAQATSAGIGIGTITPAVLVDAQGHANNGSQTIIRSKSTAANASNFVRAESSDNLYIGLLKYGTGHSAYGALPAGGGAVYANSSTPITIMSDGGSGYINFATGGNTERLRIGSAGQIGIAGANYGTDGQVLTSKGGSAAVQWADAGGVWSQINSQQISSSVSQVDVNFGANAGITTSYAQIKVYYDVWLNSGDKLYLRGAYGFSGTFTNDIKTSDYWYSGFWHRAGETNMQWPLYGENEAKALISADSSTSHHSGEMIITNAAGRLYQTGSVSWPALVYNTQGYTGGTNDAKNFTLSGHLKGGDNNPLQGIRIYSGQNIIAGEVRTYGLAAT